MNHPEGINEQVHEEQDQTLTVGRVAGQALCTCYFLLICTVTL